MKKHALITGVTGFLGSELAERLLKIDIGVVGVGRKKRGFLSDFVLNHENFIFIQKDINQLCEEDISDYGVEYIFHLASIVEYASMDYMDYMDYMDSSISLFLKIINLYKNTQSTKSIIYSSTMGVVNGVELMNENSPVSPNTNYTLSKYTCEKLMEFESIKNKNMKFITIRFPSILGKNHHGGIVHTIKDSALKNEDVELYGRGEYIRNIIYIDDAIDIMIRTIQNLNILNNYELFLAGSKNSLSVKDIATNIIKLTNSKSNIILSNKQPINNFNSIVDISKAKTILDFNPLSIEDGLMKYIGELSK